MKSHKTISVHRILIHPGSVKIENTLLPLIGALYMKIKDRSPVWLSLIILLNHYSRKPFEFLNITGCFLICRICAGMTVLLFRETVRNSDSLYLIHWYVFAVTYFSLQMFGDPLMIFIKPILMFPFPSRARISNSAF